MDVSINPVIVAPGLNGSGPGHWQSLWSPEMTGAVRTAPTSWDAPEREDWLASFDRAGDALGGRPAVVVAHSLGCRAAVLWAARAPERVAGLFCVAPPSVPAMARAGVTGFEDADQVRPPVPVLLVTSDDDPHLTPAASRALGAAWGASAIELEGLGHINADSGLGRWEHGRQLLVAFAAGL
jgi:predicted alpha/beta hydrolase family esterase